MTATYLNLRVRAPARLASLRAAAVQFNARRPPSTKKTWRDMRYVNLRTDYALSRGSEAWYSHDGAERWREQDAHEVCGFGHTGYYTDTSQDDLCIGIIARLPHGRILAGYRLTENDERVYFPQIFDDDKDAARISDEHARVYGEQAMEHAQIFDTAQAVETELETSLTRLRECIALRNKPCMDYVRDEARYLVQSIRDCRNTLATEYKSI